MRLVKIPTTRAQSERRREGRDRTTCSANGACRRTRSSASCTAPRSPPTPCSKRKGAKIGLLTTEGFKDVLEIGRQMRHSDVRPRARAGDAGVPGAGRVAQGGARARHGRRARCSCRWTRARSCARSTSWSPRASRRSRSATCSRSSIRRTSGGRARSSPSAIREHHGLAVLARSIPAFREYERTCVTAFDAYMKPVVGRYLESMEQDLAARRRPAPLQIMQSRGGISSLRDRPAAAGAAVPVGARGRRDRRPGGRPRGRDRRPDHRRYRRHELRHRPDQRRRSR